MISLIIGTLTILVESSSLHQKLFFMLVLHLILIIVHSAWYEPITLEIARLLLTLLRRLSTTSLVILVCLCCCSDLNVHFLLILILHICISVAELIISSVGFAAISLGVATDSTLLLVSLAYLGSQIVVEAISTRYTTWDVTMVIGSVLEWSHYTTIGRC